MGKHIGIIILLLLILTGGSFVGYRAWDQSKDAPAENGRSGDQQQAPIAVEVAPIKSGLIQEIRTLSGTLEARARFTVAAKVGGLIESVSADLGERIDRDQVVAEIDDAEFVQAVVQAEAELAVRKAEQARAESDRDLAQRDYDRAQRLKDRGIASESQLDETSAALASSLAELELAKARVQQAEASLELARIRLSYTNVKANWSGGPDSATVSERFQDAGNTVQSGDPIIAVAALDPLTAVVSVTERDYARLHVGQSAVLTTDARPGEEFEARVARIAPVFRESSRQARVELEVRNPENLLRPGMFIRLRVVLREEEADAIVPVAAIVERSGRQVVFLVSDDRASVTQHAVETGIEQDSQIQITSPTLRGEVVVLGQQLLEEGAPISVTESEPADRESSTSEQDAETGG